MDPIDKYDRDRELHVVPKSLINALDLMALSSINLADDIYKAAISDKSQLDAAVKSYAPKLGVKSDADYKRVQFGEGCAANRCIRPKFLFGISRQRQKMQ